MFQIKIFCSFAINFESIVNFVDYNTFYQFLEEDSNCGSPEASSSEEDSVREHKHDKTMTERGRRNRTSFTAKQLEILEAAFKANTYPDQEGREKISHSTGLSEEKIMVMFNHIFSSVLSNTFRLR